MPLERPTVEKPEGDIPFDLGIEDILLKACKGCLLVTVYLERGKEECIRRLVVHC